METGDRGLRYSEYERSKEVLLCEEITDADETGRRRALLTSVM
jgi:hypothetical protein